MEIKYLQFKINFLTKKYTNENRENPQTEA